MSKALYRKYRPTKLSDVVGQSQVTSVLENSLKEGKISHAYLFIGPRGTGKTSVARIFAHEINDFKYNIEDEYVDIIEIDGASNRGVDNIRELREKVLIAPTSGKYKVYIIDEVHMLTKEAFNALLKTIEEPPENVVFILATTDGYKVPPTITSRTQVFTFKLADFETMKTHLRKIANAENIKIEDVALGEVVRRGGGSFRDSLSLLDQISTLPGDNITLSIVENALGLPSGEKIKSLIAASASSNIADITAILRDILSTGVKPETIIEEMISRIIENPTSETLPLLKHLTEIKPPIAEFGEAKLLVALLGNIKLVSHMPNQNPISIPNPNLNQNQVPEPKRIQNPTPNPISDSNLNPTPNLTSAQETSSSSTDFNWNNFLNQVSNIDPTLSKNLAKCDYAVENGMLNIYPPSSLIKRMLESPEKLQIMSNTSGFKINLKNPGKHEKSVSKDSLIAEISDIMGGEVQNDGGTSPF